MGFQNVDAATAKLAKLNRQLQDINVTMGQTVTDWKAGTTAVQGFAAQMTILVDINKEIADGYKSQAGANQQNPDYSKAVAGKLQNVVDRIDAIMGPNNFFSAVIKNEIPQLQAGTLSPEEAMQVIQATLSPYISGLMQEVADPTTSPQMRELDQLLERLIESGAFA